MRDPLQSDLPRHPLKPAVPSRSAAEAAPRKQMGELFPYLRVGPGEPRRGRVLDPAVSRSRNFLRPAPVRGNWAAPEGPRGRGEPHTPGRVYM